MPFPSSASSTRNGYASFCTSKRTLQFNIFILSFATLVHSPFPSLIPRRQVLHRAGAPSSPPSFAVVLLSPATHDPVASSATQASGSVSLTVNKTLPSLIEVTVGALFSTVFRTHCDHRSCGAHFKWFW